MSKAAVEHPGFLVWNPSGRMPTVTHATFDAAKTEARRLAAANPGEAFFPMVPAFCVLAPRPNVEILGLMPPEQFDLDQEIPF